MAEQKEKLNLDLLQTRALNAMVNGIMITDAKRVIVWANPSFLDLTGYSLDEIVGKSTHIFDSGQHPREHYKKHREAALSGDPWLDNIIVRGKDGKFHHLRLTTSPLKDEQGRDPYFVAVVDDISEQVQAEHALKESETRLKEAEKVARLGHWELDVQADKLYWSEEICRIFEIPMSHLVLSYKDFLDVVHPRDREFVDTTYKESIAMRKPYSIDYRILLENDRVKFVHTQCETYFDEKGTAIRSIGTVQDITDRKQADEQLRKLSRAVEAAPVSIVITNKSGHIEYVNPFFSTITGYDGNEVLGENPKVLQSGNTPPETYVRLWETILGGGSWEGEFINRKKNGELYTELARIAPILDTRGNITHFVAIKKDITDRKQMENELRRREREYSSLVENTTDLIARFDTDLRYIYCNSEFKRRGSRPISAFLGRTILEVNARKRESVAVLDKAARQVLETGVMQQVEHDLLTVSGFRHYQTRLFPERDDDGRIVSIFSVGRDITDHKQLEDALREAKDFAETLATVDELTGLYNRRGFFELCRREVGRLQRFGRSFSVLFIDIDHFKQFNDRYSYEVGDRVLRQVAETLQQSVREVDVVGRYGGEEMVIMLPEIDQVSAVEIAERLREYTENLRVPSDQGELKVTVSIGIATLKAIQGQTIARGTERQKVILENLIANAGQALHVAKRQGRNQVVVYQEE